MLNDKNRRLKLIVIITIVLLSFIYNSFFYKVQADDEVSTDGILESQSESLRYIKFHRGSKQI